MCKWLCLHPWPMLTDCHTIHPWVQGPGAEGEEDQGSRAAGRQDRDAAAGGSRVRPS